MDVSYLTHNEAVKQTDHCYVINNSTGKNERPRGILFMSVKDGDREVAIELPATWIPIDLYSYASPDAVRQSVDFRTLMRENHIVAISSKEAHEILSTNAAREEKSKISLRGNVKAAEATSSAGKISINTGSSSVITESSSAAASTPTNEQLVTLIESFNNNEIMDERASETLRSMVNSGQVSLQQLQSSAMKVKNTGSGFYTTLEQLISDLASGTRSPGGTGSDQGSF